MQTTDNFEKDHGRPLSNKDVRISVYKYENLPDCIIKAFLLFICKMSYKNIDIQ